MWFWHIQKPVPDPVSTDHAFSGFTELVLLGVSGVPYNGD
jgi:hypothetical protein